VSRVAGNGFASVPNTQQILIYVSSLTSMIRNCGGGSWSLRNLGDEGGKRILNGFDEVICSLVHTIDFFVWSLHMERRLRDGGLRR
jgi:hypothetical protein